MTARAARATVVGLLLFGTTSAHADDSGSVAAATVLFDDGIKLMDAGRHEEACPKLARSQALAPSGGTLLALGGCYEKIGKIASAWVAFREAAARAANAGKQDAEAAALDRANRLEAKLPRLTIRAPMASTNPGLEIKRDGVLIKEAELGVAVPVDPGQHYIQASAPHMKSWSHAMTMFAGGQEQVAIPALVAEAGDAIPPPPPTQAPPPPVHETPAPEPPHEGGGAQRTAGLIAGGVGVASVIAGSVFGLMAKSANDEAIADHCPNNPRCDAEGVRLTDDAKSKALVSTILFAVGATGLVAGGVLFFTAPRSSTGSATGSATTVRVSPTWGGGAATLTW